MQQCAVILGVSDDEYALVPVQKRTQFLEDRFNAAVLSGNFKIDPNWARKVWDMFDDIKKSRRLAGLPSVSVDRNWPY